MLAAQAPPPLKSLAAFNRLIATGDTTAKIANCKIGGVRTMEQAVGICNCPGREK